MSNKFSSILSTISTGLIGVNMIGLTSLLLNVNPASAYNICDNNGKNIVNYETRNYWVSICEKDQRDFLVSSRKDNRGDRTIARVKRKDGGWQGEDKNDNEHYINNRRYTITAWDGRDVVDPVISVTQVTDNNDVITSRPQTCNKDYKNISNYETRNHWVNICQRRNRYYLFSHNKQNQDNSKVVQVDRQNNGWYGRENDYQYMINNQVYQITYQNRPRISEPVIRGGGNQVIDPTRPINPNINQNKQRRTCFVNRPQGLFVFTTTNSSTNPIRTLTQGERIEIFGNMIPNNAGQRFVQLTSPINGYIVASDTTANYLRDCSQPW